MKLIPKYQNAGKIEVNKRKQAFLNMNGYNIPVDGSWGKWQQEQYDKLTKKDKHYNTTPLGFLSYLYDKTLGEGTTYHEDPQLVTGYTGEIKSDDRSAAKRWLSQQMNDNSTPLGYITQTVAPAAATAGAIVYGGVPLLKATGQGIKAAVTNPQAALQTVKALPKVIKQAAPSVAKTFAKETVKGLAGATAVNVGSKLTTGKTWGQHIGELTGLSESAAEFTNPGWFVSNAPRYVFNHLPYKTIYNIERGIKNLGKDAKEFFGTPINENPIAAVKARRYRQNVGTRPRTDVGNYETHYNTNKGSLQNVNDPIPQIRKRLRNRLQNKDYMYSYPNDGFAIYLDDNMYNANHLISRIPVKEYLPLKEVYKMGLGRNSSTSNKIITAIQTPYRYVSLNTNPGFAYDHDFIKINRKALRDFGFDVPTTLSHEYNHALRNADFINQSSGRSTLKKAFDFSHLPNRVGDYLKTSTEIEARGTQLKNYFDTDVITPDMLKYASQHYVPDTGIDNNMYQFFSGIKDWKAAADYLSKFSLKNGGKLNLDSKQRS